MLSLTESRHTLSRQLLFVTLFATCQNMSFGINFWQKSRKLALYNKKTPKV